MTTPGCDACAASILWTEYRHVLFAGNPLTLTLAAAALLTCADTSALI
jgi:hypothetical protein